MTIRNVVGVDNQEILIEDLPEDVQITCYTQGDFTDLCRGPHVRSTGKVKAFKLMSVAGAYWRGDEKRQMLQRIYGTAFYKKEELEHFLYVREEAAKRDHRKLGRELDLFSFHDEGPGFPFFHPKGMVIRNALIDFERELFKKYHYEEIMTPVILSKKLWLHSCLLYTSSYIAAEGNAHHNVVIGILPFVMDMIILKTFRKGIGADASDKVAGGLCLWRGKEIENAALFNNMACLLYTSRCG